ncbi:MAG TPA: LutB/LldF family L-lactate oxidation iron-sulfur protein [Bacilli bacterium]
MGASDGTVKTRAKLALNDDFLRQAVRFTTDKLRDGKKKATEEQGNWEDWRERGELIRAHTIANLDYYLAQFAKNARLHGAHVHFARDAAEAAAIAIAIAKEKQAGLAVKSKSMVTEEIHLNQAFAKANIKSVETDLGEYIIQLAEEAPSHIIIPAIHKNRRQVAEVLSRDAGENLPPETKVLAGYVRKKLREYFLAADVGITGCNFAVAETGSIVIFENEGNARMVSTVPKTQITLMGMERLIPSLDDLEVMATLLPRSATGQRLTVYMSVITGPRRQDDGDGPENMHIIVLDNGRSLQLGDAEFQDVLNCIRCGACLNVCPVYHQVGGHTYGSTYSGPIGAILKSALNGDVSTWDDSMNLCTLCGACTEACPERIPLHNMFLHLRRRKVEAGHAQPAEKSAFKGFSYVMADAKRYQTALKFGRFGQRFIARGGVIKAKIGPLKKWTASRYAPTLPKNSFRDDWASLHRELEEQLPETSPEMLERLMRAKHNRETGGNGHGRTNRA